MNNLSIYAFFALVSYGIYFLGLKYNKSVYYFVLNNFISPYIRLNNDYFIRNFDTLINPYYKGNLPISNKPIHINRNSKNHRMIRFGGVRIRERFGVVSNTVFRFLRLFSDCFAHCFRTSDHLFTLIISFSLTS